MLDLFHELLAPAAQQPPKPATAGPLVVSVFDMFLEWCSGHRSARTYE